LHEVLHDGETALLIPPGDIAGLAMAIAHLHNDPEFGSRLAECACYLQREKYSLTAMTERYLAVYQTLQRTEISA
jgi:glycosyltransferase involved in cell wall biosynthesis